MVAAAPVAADGEPTLEGDRSRHEALAVGSRRRLLAVLQAARDPRDVAALATAVGLHVTTARSHLQVLERAGLVRRRAASSGGRTGRPRALYTAVDGPGPVEGEQPLAAMLVGELAADTERGPGIAEQAGRRWAASLGPATGSGPGAPPAWQVQAHFERLGFAPRLVEDAPWWRLELAACPFGDLARRYPQVVCTLHRGLLRGLLDRVGGGGEQATLTPFAGSGVCLVEVTTPPGCPAPAPAPVQGRPSRSRRAPGGQTAAREQR